MAKSTKAKPLRIKLTLQIEGEEGMNQFASILRLLYDNGYQPTVRRLVRLLVETARKHGAAVPPDVEKFYAEIPGESAIHGTNH